MSDTQSVSSPNNNKTVASVGSGLSGTLLGSGIVALITLRYPNLNPVEAAAIGGVVAAALGSIGVWLAPLLTAAQHHAIRALDGSDPKDILAVGKVADGPKPPTGV